MKAAMPWLGAVLWAGLIVSPSPAQIYAPALRCPVPPAPDACGTGFYYVNPWGATYGPNYYLVPPFPPVSGVPAPPVNPKCCEQPAVPFPLPPAYRGPRDYFMFTEVQRERITRDRRPILVP